MIFLWRLKQGWRLFNEPFGGFNRVGGLASAPAAIRSSLKSRNSLTFGLGFPVSATSEVLDDSPELFLAHLLVLHRAQHRRDEFVFPRTVFPKNGKQMAIIVKPAPGFAINL
jgi:hypothetical protein